MMLPSGIFALVVLLALAVVIMAPVILLVLWFRDRQRGELW